jgi:hypothetical protein
VIAVRDSGDPEALVRRHIASFASLATLRALRQVGSSDAAELAARAGASLPETNAALDELRAAGLVQVIDADAGPRFSLTSHGPLRAAVEAVLERYDQERHFRTRLVLDILRRMSFAPSRS